MARYDIESVKNIVNQNYRYWNGNTGKRLDIFWPGYGKYICPDKQSEGIEILEFKDNSTRVYFDLDAFIDFKNELKSQIPYEDTLKLAFVNYYNGNIHLDESIRVDIQQNIDGDGSKIRDFIEFVTDECAELHDVRELKKQISIYKRQKRIKGIKLSTVIRTALEVAAILK